MPAGGGRRLVPGGGGGGGRGPAPPPGGAGGVRPLLVAGRRVGVDGHPICAQCGVAVVPTGPDRWRHLPPGRPYPHGSRWLAPVTLAELRRLDTFADFAARYPAAVTGADP